MPLDSMLVTGAILIVFASFAALLLFADLTWRPRGGGRRIG